MKTFPWIMLLALLPSFSNAMEIQEVKVNHLNELPTELYTKIMLHDDQTFTAFRQINRSANEFSGMVKAKNKQKILKEILAPLLDHNLRFPQNRLQMNTIITCSSFSSEEGYNLEGNYFHEDKLEWNKRGSKCSFLMNYCESEHRTLNVFGQNGCRTAMIPKNAHTLIFSKPFFNKNDSACLLMYNKTDNKLSEFSVDDTGYTESRVSISFPPESILHNCIVDAEKIKELPVFLRACAQSRKVITYAVGSKKYKIYDIMGTSLPLVAQKWIEAYCGNPSTTRRQLKDPVTDAVFHYIGGNSKKAYDIVAYPPHYIEKSTFNGKRIVEHNDSYAFSKNDIEDCLKQCSLENTEPLQYFINNSTITHFIGPDGGTIGVEESCTDQITKTLRFSSSYNASLPSCFHLPRTISTDQKCIKACKQQGSNQWAYVLKNRNDKTYDVYWHHAYDLDQTTFTIESSFRALEFDEMSYLKLIMKPKTWWDYICMPVRYYTQGDQSYTLKREFVNPLGLANPLSLLVVAYRYVKKHLYDYQG
jgi:hypothetical protein